MNFFINYIYLWLITIIGTALGTIIAMWFLYKILKIPQKLEEYNKIQKEILESTKLQGRFVASNLENKKITFYISEISKDFENNIFRDFSDFLKNREIIHFRHEIDSENFKNECLKIFNQNSNPSIRIQFKPNPDELIVGYDEERLQKSFDDYFVSFKIKNIQKNIEELKNREIIYFRYWTAGEYDVIDGKIHTTVLHNFVEYLKSAFGLEPTISSLKEENLNLYKQNPDPSNHPRLLITLNGKTEFETVYFLDEIDKIQDYFGLLFLEFKKAQPGWFEKIK